MITTRKEIIRNGLAPGSVARLRACAGLCDEPGVSIGFWSFGCQLSAGRCRDSRDHVAPCDPYARMGSDHHRPGRGVTTTIIGMIGVHSLPMIDWRRELTSRWKSSPGADHLDVDQLSGASRRTIGLRGNRQTLPAARPANNPRSGRC